MKLEAKITFLKTAEKRGDEWSQKVIERIQHEPDLVAADAWYHSFCHKKLYQSIKCGAKRGRRPASSIDEAMEAIFTYIETKFEECQFSLDELMNQIPQSLQPPDSRTVKARIIHKYGDDVLISENKKKKTVLCFKNVGHKILTDHWYSNRNLDPQKERLRIVKTACDIIVEDIRSQMYDVTQYPPSDNFLSDAETVIPESVKLLFETIVLKHKRGSVEKLKKKCVAFSHALISAVRPRSFLSSIMTGISAYLYRKFGSKHLLQVLSAFGFAGSYEDASLLELSTIMRPQNTKQRDDAFCQFIFDNADFNVNTLDGTGTCNGGYNVCYSSRRLVS